MVTLLPKSIQGFSVAAVNNAGIGEYCPIIQAHIAGNGGNESMQSV